MRTYYPMPDHLHVLLQGIFLNADLLNFIGNFKHKTSRRFSSRNPKTLWQTSF
jgi:REP element-mobilizing transposase RayT